jgi:hypothetical protein
MALTNRVRDSDKQEGVSQQVEERLRMADEHDWSVCLDDDGPDAQFLTEHKYAQRDDEAERAGRGLYKLTNEGRGYFDSARL